MIIVDRHRVVALIELSRASSNSAAAKAANREAFETVLVGLYMAATPAARAEFLKQMDPVPATEKPWAAVELGPALGFATTPPAVTILVLGQLDDDPDAAEDGNRLPEPASAAAAPWAALLAALARWDTPVILRHVGPLGWQLPVTRVVPLDEGMAVERVSVQASMAPAPSSAPSSPPTPTSPAPPTDFWRRPSTLAAGGVVLALATVGVVRLATTTSPPPRSEVSS